MAGISYLDIDDEITSAAARIRSTEGSRVAVVLPYGSRVATSRINSRLLARDALTNGKRLSIVAGDGEADCTITMAASDYVAMVEGRANPQQLFFTGKLTVDGDMMLATKLGDIADILK